jgi:hypothetical protein
VHGGALEVTVNTSGAGKVTITGAGLAKTTVALPTGTSTVKVALTKAGKRDRAHQRTIKIAVSLAAGGSTASASARIKL